jgi:Transcriptional regulator containing GAF, AAA-type ATPase, and DNA binding domains
MSAPARIREERILRLLVEGTVAETGAGFFRALVGNLGEALQTRGAWVTEYLPESRRLRALAFWLDEGFVALPGSATVAAVETAAPTSPRILSAAELLELEKTNLRRALETAGGKISGPGGVAELLGLPASTVTSRVKALGLRRS